MLRLVFFGSPDFAVPSLKALLDAGHTVSLVVSQPDRPAGRGRKLTPPPVAQFAHEHGLAVWQTSTLRGAEAEDRLRVVQADAMALAAFAAIVPRNVLDMAPGGVLNVHPSLLPRWRGASPIQSALLAGDAHTGVSIIRLAPAMDAGPILAQQVRPITDADDYLSLERDLSELGARMLLDVLGDLEAGRVQPREQDDTAATYCQRIERADAVLEWQRPAVELWRMVRAYRAWPQAQTTWQGKLLKVLRASLQPAAGLPPGVVDTVAGWPVVGAANGGLRLDEVVLEGRGALDGRSFLRGQPRFAGSHLGT